MDIFHGEPTSYGSFLFMYLCPLGITSTWEKDNRGFSQKLLCYCKRGLWLSDYTFPRNPRWKPLLFAATPSPSTRTSLLLPRMPSSWDLSNAITDHSSPLQKSTGMPCKLMYSRPLSHTAWPITLVINWVMFCPPALPRYSKIRDIDVFTLNDVLQ